MIPILKYILWFLLGLVIIFVTYFFVGFANQAKKMTWGINFSVKQTDFLKLESKETYLAILNDLKPKNLKISVYWDLIEKEKGVYDFSELDWQMKEAEKRNVSVILAIGMKVPRWPECHLPTWARDLSKEQQQAEILNILKEVVSRYKNSSALSMWQVENEAFLKFGACPWIDEGFLKEEISFVKINDPKHKVLVTDSGELSFWFKVSQVGGDVVGVTTYRNVWQQQIRAYVSYLFPPVFYNRRADLVKNIFNQKVIGVELQAEPWCTNSIMNSSLEEQEKTMNLAQFKKNVEFAKNTGMDTFYFWGAEWWYYMKTVYNNSEIWDEAKKLF
ncbi:MAG: endo-1,4-beta-xylanase [Candidatus Paceibacterota bacterium]|jgi:hypothetical protein